jgi:hypothetical protein
MPWAQIISHKQMLVWDTKQSSKMMMMMWKLLLYDLHKIIFVMVFIHNIVIILSCDIYSHRKMLQSVRKILPLYSGLFFQNVCIFHQDTTLFEPRRP